MMKNLVSRALCAAVLAVGLAGGPVGAHGQVGQDSPSTSSKLPTIFIHGYNYTVPDHVSVGAKMKIVNKNVGRAHTVTADDGSFDVYVAARSTAYMKAPSQPGRYSFYCIYHGRMHGVLVVK